MGTALSSFWRSVKRAGNGNGHWRIFGGGSSALDRSCFIAKPISRNEDALQLGKKTETKTARYAARPGNDMIGDGYATCRPPINLDFLTTLCVFDRERTAPRFFSPLSKFCVVPSLSPFLSDTPALSSLSLCVASWLLPYQISISLSLIRGKSGLISSSWTGYSNPNPLGPVLRLRRYTASTVLGLLPQASRIVSSRPVDSPGAQDVALRRRA